MDLNQDFDYEGEDDLALGSPNESRPMACSISTPNVPKSFLKHCNHKQFGLKNNRSCMGVIKIWIDPK